MNKPYRKGRKMDLMKVKAIVVSSFLVLCMFGVGIERSYALTQTVDLSSGYASFVGSGTSILSAGQDIVNFSNLPIGLYNFDFSMSAQYVNISSVFVNGQAAAQTSLGIFRYLGLTSVDTTPFTVTINGVSAAPVGKSSLYSGELQVSRVPEPTSFLLLLLGTGMVFLTSWYRKTV